MTVGAVDPLKVAVVADLVEEGWPSMDLVAEMLVEHLPSLDGPRIAPTLIRPPMARRATRLPRVGGGRRARNLDRLANRFHDYPRALRGRRDEFAVFHVVDHSYAQLVHALPAERTVVTCHDLDTFRSVLEPERDPRPAAFRRMAARILDGLRRAARVTCDAAAVRDELLAHGVVPHDRVVVVPMGIHPSCSAGADPEADEAASRLLGPLASGGIEILHVGSTIDRKRIDVLLRVVAAVRRSEPGVRLVRVGGEFTGDQERLARDLGLRDAVRVLPRLDRRTLAAVYRRAALVLLPSEREGFGLPVVEAMACGTPVVASDLAVLREVGGGAALYGPVGEPEPWATSVLALLAERRDAPAAWDARRAAGLARAERFGWSETARGMAAVYLSVARPERALETVA